MSADLIPVRMINEYVFCKRLFWIEYVASEFQESADTIYGTYAHRNVDKPKVAKNGMVLTAVNLSSDRYGITGRLDLVEKIGDEYAPVEFKKGGMKKGPWRNDISQLVAQCLLLREGGYKCNHGYIFYAENGKRIKVSIDDGMIRTLVSLIDEIRDTARLEAPPPPINDERCSGCSLNQVCMPDETKFLSGDANIEIRRLRPMRQDRYPVYVTDQGSVVKKEGNRLAILGKERTYVDLIQISSVSVFGNIQITSQAMQTLLKEGIPVAYFSTNGWLYGMFFNNFTKNSILRLKQYGVSVDQGKRIDIAKSIVKGKIKNQRTLIRRNAEGSEKELRDMMDLVARVDKCNSIEELLGIEGEAARVYFSAFSKLLSHLDFTFQGRNRRPSTDPVNSMLSFLYAVLAKDAMSSLLLVGLDPYIGFYHSIKYGKPSLALDIMEEFRPLIVDSTVLRAVNSNQLDQEDFTTTMGAVAIKDNARRKLLRLYEERMDTVITHPLFGYKLTYRQTLEIQARLLSKVVMGEFKIYRAFTTR